MLIRTFCETYFLRWRTVQLKIIGGDKRFEILGNMLIEDGHTLSDNSHIIVLPLPLTRDGENLNAPRENTAIRLSDIILAADEGDVFFGGLIPSDFAAKIRATGAVIYDYNALDRFAALNAVPTAEGAVAIAINNTDYSLNGAKCLVSGYGKIGKVLARYLKALGAEVTVSARKQSDFSIAEKEDIKHIHSGEIGQHIAEFPLIFNTVPHRIFGTDAIKSAAKGTLYIELASSPYGIDFDSANAAGITVINAPSLPARVAPVTAAKNIYKAIFHIIREEFS